MLENADFHRDISVLYQFHAALQNQELLISSAKLHILQTYIPLKHYVPELFDSVLFCNLGDHILDLLPCPDFVPESNL